MKPTRECVSPENQLRFVVDHDEKDVSLGFEGFPWHTHADVLASALAMSEELAVDRFVRDLLSDRSILAVSRIGGTIRDVRITADPQADLRYESDDDVLGFRYWSGGQWKPTQSAIAADPANSRQTQGNSISSATDLAPEHRRWVADVTDRRHS